MNPLPAAPALGGCCGLRPKPPRPPTGASRVELNFLEPDFRYFEADDSGPAEPVFTAPRRRTGGRGDAPGNAPRGADAAEEDDAGAGRAGRGEEPVGTEGEEGGRGTGRRSGGAAADSSFFAPSSAAAGREHVAVVQGASRGIGLELVRQLLERTDLKARGGGRVVATCRHPESADALQELLAYFGPSRLTLLAADVTDEATVEAAAQAVEHRFGRCDLLVNAAGVLHIPGELQPETSLAALTADAMLLTYRVNAIGPMLVLKHFAPLLRRTASSSAARGGSAVVPLVANISARVSSIRENRLGGWHAYRASKAALNMLTKTAAVELGQGGAPVTCVLLHPGTVATDLSRPFNRNVPAKMLFSAETAVRCMLAVICRATPADSGKLISWDGNTIDW